MSKASGSGGKKTASTASASTDAPTTMNYSLYRKSTLGIALEDAIEDLQEKYPMEDGRRVISDHLQNQIMLAFDKYINEALATKVKTKVQFKGHCHTYRCVDNVYMFLLKNPEFRIDNETIKVDLVKIVACDGGRSRESTGTKAGRGGAGGDKGKKATGGGGSSAAAGTKKRKKEQS
eukprot:GEZU01013526.1.p1 GENE.GEZU01013526.1~~GEZU01013526.1.p1  ORF type:complete len:177 (-),score=47.42 GEZU01013526.1:118-648(-)